jgi:hypothetical protein
LVNQALSANMVVNKSDAVGLGIAGVGIIEIDAVFQKDGACNAGAVVGDLSALAGDRGRSYEFHRGLYDR